MRAVIQRVSRASVTVNGGEPRTIGRGIVILLGVGDTDTLDIVPKLAEKCAHLRIFEDEAGKLNRSAANWATRRWWSPTLPCTAIPAWQAPQLYTRRAARSGGALLRTVPCGTGQPGPARVQHGEFGADMQVRLCNDGPVTIVIDTDEWKK